MSFKELDKYLKEENKKNEIKYGINKVQFRNINL